MDNQRLFLYGALLFVCYLIWQTWEKEHIIPSSVVEAPAEQPTEINDRDIPAIANESVSPAPAAQAATAEPAVAMVEQAARVTARTDVLKLEFTTRGGDIEVAELLEYPESKQQPDVPVRLLSDRNERLFITQSGLRPGRDSTGPDHRSVFHAGQDSYELATNETELVVRFFWNSGTGLEVEKRYTLTRGRYEIKLDTIVHNGGGTEWRGDAYLQLKKRQQEQSRSFLNPQTYSYTGPAIYDGEKYRKLKLSDIAETALAETVPGGWVAMLQHYFLAAAIPPRDAQNRFYAVAVGDNTYRVGYVQPGITIPAGSEGSFHDRLFVGPKLQDRLAEITPKLELAVDYGMLTIIAEPLFWLMEKIHALVGNWGWAIILLTLLIKAGFYKLSEASGKSMAKMRRIQPRLQALKERYGDDRERLNKAMMELYKSEKINPAAGCLPILIQLPVFIALYWVLLESVELRQAEWMLWINDLSSPDPFYILPVLMGVAMFAQQRLNPTPPDPIQAKMLMAMPLMMIFFATIMPSGLVLYWVVNTVLSAAQQWQINRVVEKKGYGRD